QNQLRLHGQLEGVADVRAFPRLAEELRAEEWVVYAKPPFGGPEQVLTYLARYTHRVAISKHRLVKVENDRVFFHDKDYADDNTQKTMSLEAVEFIRRFLQHVVPSGFVRIRHFGFLAHRLRAAKLKQCRQLIASANGFASMSAPSAEQVSETAAEVPPDRHRCPHCGNGPMRIVERLARAPAHPAACSGIPDGEDTS